MAPIIKVNLSCLQNHRIAKVGKDYQDYCAQPLTDHYLNNQTTTLNTVVFLVHFQGW